MHAYLVIFSAYVDHTYMFESIFRVIVPKLTSELLFLI